MATSDASWYGTGERVSRRLGRLFELACLTATSVGILSVFILLLYVANDAFRPLSADPLWYVVFAVTLVAPVVALAAYYYRTDSPNGEVAYVTTGLPVVGVLIAGGLFVLFVEILPIKEWFALGLSIAAIGAVLYGHTRVRPGAILERTLLGILVPVVAILGAPPVSVARLVGLPVRVVSLREFILQLPYLPLPSLQLTATLTAPAAAVAGWWVWKKRESRRDGVVAGGLVVAGALVGLVAGDPLGIGADGWVIIYTMTVVPVAVYAEGVFRRGEGVAGLLLPVTLLVGGALGGLLVGQLGASGPETWLDWEFLTSMTTRSAETAGIYPALVGSVMLLIVIVVTTFPVGVGAAVYLEEYAPSSGPVGKLVTLIEINIANLAGVPSVVYGLLGLAVFIRFFQMPSGSIIVGGLAIGLLILPIIIISAQEAIRAVPDSQRQASYGMGATQWQTTRKVVLPEALPGIMTGTILALGRAIGETAPLLLIGMAASVREAPNSFFDKSSAMPRQVFSWAFEIEPAFRYGVLAAGVVTLLVVLLVMNASAIVIRNKYQRD
ncbi:MAG: phosphate ABC transporter permease PstA [Haloarculaceae archaeon]